MIRPKYDEHGNCIENKDYKEIHKLHQMLVDAGIPHDFERNLDGWQVTYPSIEKFIIDAIQHFGSYGAGQDLLESISDENRERAGDSCEGYLTASEVFKRINKIWEDEQCQSTQ